MFKANKAFFHSLSFCFVFFFVEKKKKTQMHGKFYAIIATSCKWKKKKQHTPTSIFVSKLRWTTEWFKMSSAWWSSSSSLSTKFVLPDINKRHDDERLPLVFAHLDLCFFFVIFLPFFFNSNWTSVRNEDESKNSMAICERQKSYYFWIDVHFLWSAA